MTKLFCTIKKSKINKYTSIINIYKYVVGPLEREQSNLNNNMKEICIMNE